MPDLRFDNPASTEAFLSLCAEHGLRLPLDVGEDGGIVDADGDEIATVDVNRQLVDAEAEAIAMLIVMAVNTCGGYRAVEG